MLNTTPTATRNAAEILLQTYSKQPRQHNAAGVLFCLETITTPGQLAPISYRGQPPQPGANCHRWNAHRTQEKPHSESHSRRTCNRSRRTACAACGAVYAVTEGGKEPDRLSRGGCKNGACVLRAFKAVLRRFYIGVAYFPTETIKRPQRATESRTEGE